MKFGKEYQTQMVPEWQEAYLNYNDLKILLKEIQRSTQTSRQTGGVKRAMTLYRAFSGLVQRNNSSMINPSRKDVGRDYVFVASMNENGAHEKSYLQVAEEGGHLEKAYFKRLDEEFQKVEKFYTTKVSEVVAEADHLSEQMDALIAFRLRANISQGESGESDVDEPKFAERKLRTVNANKTVPLDIIGQVEVNKTFATPASMIRNVVYVPTMTEEGYIKGNLKKVETQLSEAFVEFYRKLRHLKSYSFLNILAFSKIMKKYDKFTLKRASQSYMKLVDNSYLGSSNEVTKLMERVEATFVKHFANSNRAEGMKVLRPTTKIERHRISFSIGLFVGCSLALVLALILIINARKLLDKKGQAQYMENMFPLYSFFAFIVLHMLMYSGNVFFWRLYRVNYPFIFGFKQGTELGYREVLLVGFGLATFSLTCVISNLDLEMNPKTEEYEALTELLPLGLVLLVTVVMICPFNIIYRSSRFFFLRCMFHCAAAPFYKVTLQDFFLADQLTSQVQAFRSLEFYICYYGRGDYKLRENHCKSSGVYNCFYFIVAIIPYWSRLLQCLRRLVEEKDPMQGYNGLKYLVAIVAISARTAFSLYKGYMWKILSWIFSTAATGYGIYWDLIVDWGLLQRHSKNPWLRDKLLLPSRGVYFGAMVVNVLLRLAWLQTLLNIRISFIHKETLITIMASLEIIRRGIWNFFRLENEHLNNVGKYRAFKTVPLPFTYRKDEGL